MGTRRERDHTEPEEQVHVRILGVGDTLRWSWGALTDRLELVGLMALVGLLSVVMLPGISQPSPTEPPEIEVWVWPVYLVYSVAIAGVWAIVYEVSGTAVGNSSEPFRQQVESAVTRIPALIATAILTLLITAIGFMLLVLPGIYLLHRFLLAFPAVVIDEEGPVSALKTSWATAGGNVLKIFSVAFLYYVSISASTVVAGVFGPYTILSSLVNVATNAVLVPLFGLAFGHLYLEASRNT